MPYWTQEMTDAYLAEMKRRWIDRADNPKSVLDYDAESIVGRSEMRLWAEQNFGIFPPEMDLKWAVRMTHDFRKFVAKEARKRGLRYRRPTSLQLKYERDILGE